MLNWSCNISGGTGSSNSARDPTSDATMMPPPARNQHQSQHHSNDSYSNTQHQHRGSFSRNNDGGGGRSRRAMGDQHSEMFDGRRRMRRTIALEGLPEAWMQSPEKAAIE